MSGRRITVLGAGNWGTALAIVAARGGHDVRLWARESAVVEGIASTRTNPLYLQGFELPGNIEATGSLVESVDGADVILVVIPSQYVRSALFEIRDVLPEVPLVLCSKGIEKDTLLLMKEVVADVLERDPGDRVSVLSGPSFAREVAEDMPTNVTVASAEGASAAEVQAALSTRRFRIYTSTDVVGVEVGGAVKNVIAIAAGAVEGMGFGHNTKAGLITRGLAEMNRLNLALGGDPITLAGLSGMGDLVLTCTGHLSRNRTVGEVLAKGGDPRMVLEDMVAEGVETSRSVHLLADRLGVDMPIATEVYRVLHESKPIGDALETLLSRDLKPELTP